MLPTSVQMVRGILFALALSVLLAAGTPGAFAAVPGADATPGSEAPSRTDTQTKADTPAKSDTPVKDDSLAQLWSSRAGDLAVLVKEASNLRASAESMAAPLAVSLQDARTQASRLSSLFQASRGHPMEQFVLVRQMHNLREKLHNQMKPLEDIAATIGQRLEDIAALQKDMDDFARDSAADAAVSAAEQTELKNYTRTMADARSKLTSAATRLEKLLGPARAASTRLDQSITSIEGSMGAIWENYYLTPSNYDLGAYISAPTQLSEWAASSSTRLRLAYPQSLADWQEAGKSFAIAIVIMVLFGFLASRSAHILPQRWHQACVDIFKGAWLGVGGGVSFLVASSDSSGGFYSAFVLIGVLAIVAGVVALSWRLRTTVNPTLKDMPSPLNRLMPPAFTGVFMLFSDLPPRILSLGWGVVMLAFLGWIYFLNRKRGSVSLPLLERLSYGCAFWVGLASLLTAFAGYARLAILLFMALFALVNTCTLGNALTALFQNLGDALFNKEKQPVRNAIADALSIPVAWLLSLLCTLPWLWAVPGARYLLRSAMEANYTLGEASFDFSRLVLIVVLFFLVRSFISLCTTSLSHLPDHMPHIERGVIPPLRTVVRYLSWAIFGLIVLGSLGVNFTSLAVVAGGLSVGIGFGVQNLFNNLISGLILIFGRTILVGDFVDVAGVSGTVKAINIRSTTIETPERALVYVPNSSIMSGHFSNWTRNSRMVRRSILIGVAYGSDTELVSKLLLEAANKQEHTRKIPPPAVYFTDFGANSLDFTLNVFIDDIDNSVSTLSAIRFDMEKAFAEHGIDIPFPQLALHVTEQGSGLLSGAVGNIPPVAEQKG